MVALCPHERAHIPLRVKWLNNRNANTYLVDNPDHVTNEKEQNAWFDRYEADDAKRFFTILAGETPIGFAGLSHIDLERKQASVFIVIGEDDYRGKGNGKAALSLLLEEGLRHGVEIFTLDVFKANVPAVRLYAGAGFSETGVVDNAMMSMSLTFAH